MNSFQTLLSMSQLAPLHLGVRHPLGGVVQVESIETRGESVRGLSA